MESSGHPRTLFRSVSLALHEVTRPNLTIYGWGRNDCGQLGFPPLTGSSSNSSDHIGSSSSTNKGQGPCGPTPPGVIPTPTRIGALEEKDVVELSASLYNTAALTADGELYMLGSNDSAMLARRPKPPGTTAPTPTTAAAAGGADPMEVAQQHSRGLAALDVTGASDYSYSPVRVEALETQPLGDVGCGVGHVVVATRKGLLASWGDGEFGQLGTGRSTPADSPQHHPKILRGTAVAAGGSSSSSSSSSSGTAGLRFCRVAAGGAYSLALTSNGMVFSFGQGDFGALGQQEPPPLKRTNTATPSPSSTSSATAHASTPNGPDVTTAGDTTALVTASTANSLIPRPIPGLWGVGVVQISAGENHCAALSVAGGVYTWGRGKYGALGLGDFSNRLYPQLLPAFTPTTKPLQIVCGGDHTLLLGAVVPQAVPQAVQTAVQAADVGSTVASGAVQAGGAGAGAGSTGDGASSTTGGTSSSSNSNGSSSPGFRVVYAWGRGTHGATGLGFQENVCRPSRVQALEGQHVVQLAAGRQHSLALTSEGALWAWGAGDQGQLGLGCSTRSNIGQTSPTSHVMAVDQEAISVDWLLPRSKTTPVKVPLELPATARVLYVAAGGDHSLAVVQQQQQQLHQGTELERKGRSSSSKRSLEQVLEAAAAGAGAGAAGEESTVDVATDKTEAAVAEGAGAKALAAAMEVDGQGFKPGKPSNGGQHTAVKGQSQRSTIAKDSQPSSPDPSKSPYGANSMPLMLPQLLQLAAAAAEAKVEEKEAAAKSSSTTTAAAAAVTLGQSPVPSPRSGFACAATATAASSTPAAAAATSTSRRSATPAPPAVLDLAQAVYDVFSCPGFLLAVLKQQQHTAKLLQPTAIAAAAAAGDTGAMAPSPRGTYIHTPVKGGSSSSNSSSHYPDHGFDLAGVQQLYSAVLRSYAPEAVAALGSALARLLQELPNSREWSSGSSLDVVRLVFVLLQNPLNSEHHGIGATLLALLTAITLNLNRAGIALLMHWIGGLRPEVFGGVVVRPIERLITRLATQGSAQLVEIAGRQAVVRHVLGEDQRGDILQLGRLLDVLHEANEQAGGLIHFSQFANAELSKAANLHEEYFRWLRSGNYRAGFEAWQQLLQRQQQQLMHQQEQQQQQGGGQQRQGSTGLKNALSGGVSSGGQTAGQTPGQMPGQTHGSDSETKAPPPAGAPAAAAAVGGSTPPHMSGAGFESPPSLSRLPGRSPGSPVVSLCEVPFLLTPEAKSQVLQDESSLQQQHVMHASAMSALLEGVHPGHAVVLELRVRRGHVLEDALVQIQSHYHDLKKPLRVTFLSEDGSIAEEGLDQGGVSREFFQILTHELFNPDFGMFSHVEESRVMWFNPASLASKDEYELVGCVLGLAIYNGIILDVHLPLVAYKKIMGGVPTFEDLASFQPTLYKSLQQLLSYEGDVHSTFNLFFEVEYSAYGATAKAELIPNGSVTPVTNSNRWSYVQCYTRWLLGSSVAEQFAAFAGGFHRVCGGPALSLFRYEEVELLVCGLPHLDFQALQQGARYEGGFRADSPAVKALWSVLDELSLEHKKAFLQFVTGCDRAPVAGLGSLHLLVQRAGPDSERLPTAHTCFNTLLLPEYSSREKLQDKLRTAIRNAAGFGLQ